MATYVSHNLNNHNVHFRYAPSEITDPEWSTSQLYNTVADAYASYGWIPSEDLTFFRLDGYYSTLIRPGLRAISLNGMFQYSFNLYVRHLNQPGGLALIFH